VVGLEILTSIQQRQSPAKAAISALRKAQNSNLPTVALMCDVDRFKAINDRFGHEFGDKVLVQIAGVLRSFES
jgi:diguanylate cyclase (GGDEF)-like protein